MLIIAGFACELRIDGPEIPDSRAGNSATLTVRTAGFIGFFCVLTGNTAGDLQGRSDGLLLRQTPSRVPQTAAVLLFGGRKEKLVRPIDLSPAEKP